MPATYLTCGPCQIRIRAAGPRVDEIDGMCPTCGAQLQLAARVASVLGLRSFDWFADDNGDTLTGTEPPAPPADLQAHRERSLALDTADAARWSNDGGSPAAAAEAVAPWPASR
jgi:hypothetical protein